MRQVPVNAAHTRQLIALLLVIFLDSFAYFLVIPVFLRLFIHDDLGLIPQSTSLHTRNLWYSLSIMLPAFASLLTAPLIGYLSDRYGRKRIILGCLLSTLVGFILPIIGIWAKSLSFILLGRLITGVATGNQAVAQAAITDFSSGKQKAFYLGLIALAMTLAMMLGPLAGGYLSDSQWGSLFSVMTPYELGIGVSLASMVLLIFSFSDAAKKDQVENVRTRLSAFSVWKVGTSPLIGLWLFVLFLLEVAWSQYYQAIPLYLSEKMHYTVTKTSSFISYTGIWMLLGLAIIYPIIIRLFTVRRITTVSLILAGVGCGICALLPGSLSQWVGVIFIAVFVGITYCGLLVLISHRVATEYSTQYQGAIMGIASALLQGAWMITAFLSGFLTNIAPRLPLLLAMGAMMVGVLFLLGGVFRNKAYTLERE